MRYPKRHLALLVAVVLVTGGSAAAASSGGINVPTWDDFTTLSGQVDDLAGEVRDIDARLAAFEEAPAPQPEPQEPEPQEPEPRVPEPIEAPSDADLDGTVRFDAFADWRGFSDHTVTRVEQPVYSGLEALRGERTFGTGGLLAFRSPDLEQDWRGEGDAIQLWLYLPEDAPGANHRARVNIITSDGPVFGPDLPVEPGTWNRVVGRFSDATLADVLRVTTDLSVDDANDEVWAVIDHVQQGTYTGDLLDTEADPSDPEPTEPEPTDPEPSLPADYPFIGQPTQVGNASQAFVPPWHQVNSESPGRLDAVRPQDVNVANPLPGEIDVIARARFSDASGSQRARAIFEHGRSDAVPYWTEGSEIWYGGFFYFRPGFKSALNSSVDFHRWDVYATGSNDMQGGLGVRTNGRLRIQNNWPFREPLIADDYTLQEGRWLHIEVGQKLSSQDGGGWSEIWVDGDRVARSTNANYYGDRYSGDAARINRHRIGLFGSAQRNPIELLFAYQTIGDTRHGDPR